MMSARRAGRERGSSADPAARIEMRRVEVKSVDERLGEIVMKLQRVPRTRELDAPENCATLVSWSTSASEISFASQLFRANVNRNLQAKSTAKPSFDCQRPRLSRRRDAALLSQSPDS